MRSVAQWMLRAADCLALQCSAAIQSHDAVLCTGSQPIGAFLDERDRLGYEGFVGLEYRPLVDTATSLEWMKAEASRPP
jgi:hypothetical protein